MSGATPSDRSVTGPPPMTVTWHARWPPLPPAAVCATGPAARRLAERLLRPDADLALLAGVGTPDLLVLTGPVEALPWVDGAFYLGRDPSAPELLLPTTSAPNAPAALFRRALLGPREGLAPPVAVWPTADPDTALAALSLVDAHPVEPERVRAWLEAAR